VPGWLVQRGKIDEAEKVLAMTHKGVSGYDVKEELVRDPTHTETLSDTPTRPGATQYL
jgi:hypothetical protein